MFSFDRGHLDSRFWVFASGLEKNVWYNFLHRRLVQKNMDCLVSPREGTG